MIQGIFFTTIQGPSTMGAVSGITIGREAVKNGLLKRLKGPLLPTYLYLAAQVHLDLKGQFIISDAISSLDCTRKDLLKALIQLEEEDLIQLLDLDPTREKRPILFALKMEQIQKEKNEEEFIASILKKEFCRNEELVEGLVALYRMPHGLEPHGGLRQEIEDYFHTFDPQVIKEILHRSFTWGKKTSRGKPFQYFQSILEDLKEAGVFHYEDLKGRDRLYQQLKELARSCGIKVHELNQNPTQRQILTGWITKQHEEDFALELEVALLAVEEATRNSRSRHPSLGYIEKNYILPWKESQVENIQQAQRLLRGNRRTTPPSQEKEPAQKSLHDQFAIWAQ